VNAPRHRSGMRRAIVILPGAFTSGNLFFGIWSIIESARGNFEQAAWFVVAGAFMDALDGSAARMTKTGSAFGAELDSLVDAISFGVAPAMLVYFHTFHTGEWAWLLSFLFILAVVLRLARFNVEQAGRAKSQFFGLPSPGAGIALATFYPFTQTAFYQANLFPIVKQPLALAVFMIGCSLLMVSHVPYPVWPKPGLRSAKGIITLVVSLVAIALILAVPEYFIFPFIFLYILFGLGRAALLGFLDKRPDNREPLHDDDGDADRPMEGEVNPKLVPFQVQQRPRRRTGGNPE
jgi:CDP-diacylglycerol--serine O-phosphatidyltransferase